MLHKDCHYITFYSSLHLGPHLNLFKTFQILIIPFSFRANQQQNSWGILEELVQQQQKSKYFLHFVWLYVLFTRYNSIAFVLNCRAGNTRLNFLTGERFAKHFAISLCIQERRDNGRQTLM